MKTGKSIYLIDNSVFFIPKERILLNYNMKKNNEIGIVKLRVTNARLLYFLAKNANEEYCSIDKILYEVWDTYNLSSSDQALRRSLLRLKKQFSEIEINSDVIIRDHNMGIKVIKTLEIYTCQYCELYPCLSLK